VKRHKSKFYKNTSQISPTLTQKSGVLASHSCTAGFLMDLNRMEEECKSCMRRKIRYKKSLFSNLRGAED
ncbi:hypothetical protein, partial [Limnovirga soli]|uniref:hypothetical protein n=1 Tax=Limnovirga soli TaxID=2656915 RepID=UPI001C0EA20E